MKFIKRHWKKMNLKYLISAVIFLAASAAYAQDSNGNSAGIVIDKIIAKVDNNIVLKSDVERAYLDYLSNGGKPSERNKCGLLAQLISGKLMVAKAEIDSVIVTEDIVDRNLEERFRMILSQFGGSEEQLEEYYGKTLEEIKSDVRDQVKEQLTIQRMQNHITENITVTPAEVKRFFDKIPSDSLPYFSTEVEVAQIVKIPETGEEQKQRAREKLIELRKRILAGEDFAELAKEYSEGPSAKYGGDLGYASRGAMVPAYEAVALKLKPNELSMPVETKFGLHLIQLLDRRGNEYHSRHILLMPEPSEEDIKRAEDYLDSLKSQINAGKITFPKAAKEYSEDQQTSGNGGFFADENGGTRISTDNLDPVVYFTVTDSMQVGEISKPLRYRTDDGKQSVRLLYYKSRVRPHQANLKDDWQKIRNAALEEKKMRVLNEWFDKAREEVFINIDDDYSYCNIMR
jgi:peptidyl-prolyl cis-trans isomerase SurA